MSEGYNGWANRETWALALNINNDKGLYDMFTELVRDMRGEPDYEVEDAIESLVKSLLIRSAYEDEYGDTQPAALTAMAEDVGALWRVDWVEIRKSLEEGI